MLLQDFLNSNFPVDTDPRTIVNYFFDTFGVNVKVEGDLFLFKYDMIAAKWLEPITHDCRGTIMRNTFNGWKICSRPWNKFFNQHEGHCPIFKNFEEYLKNPKAYIMEKVDGTAIQLWYDDMKKEWRVSTLGSISTTNINDMTDFTFADLFLKIIREKMSLVEPWTHMQMFDMIQGNTIMFELCTKHNRILTKYPDDRIYLISMRNNETGEYTDKEILESLNRSYIKAYIPKSYTFNELQLTSLEGVLRFVEVASKDADTYGEFAEGFVCYDNGTPIAKIKNQTYLSLHHLSGGDKAHTRNYIIEAFFNANMDDVMKVIDDDMKEFVEKIRMWYIIKVDAITKDVKKISSQTYATQKDYALAVQTLKDPSLLSMYFANKDKILKGSFDHDDINGWFKKFYEKYEKELKALQEI